MRNYNKREKEFLKLLEEISKDDLEFFSFFLQNKYFVGEGNSALLVIPHQTQALLFIKKSIFDDLKLRKAEIKKFLEILSLTEYLKQNRLIDIIPNPQAKNFGLHVMYKNFNLPSQASPASDIILNKDGLHIKITDISKIYNKQNEILFEAVALEKYTYEIIMNNFMGLLFVSEELNDYVRRGFKSIDDIRYKYGQIATWVSISMALIFGIIGIYNPFSKNEIKSYRLDKQQLDSVLEYKKDMNQNVQEILKVIKPNNKTDSIRSK